MTELHWQPAESSRQDSILNEFWCSLHSDNKLCDFQQIYIWSIQNRELFWEAVFNFFEIKYSKKWFSILDESQGMFRAKWFDGCKLNYAENLLRFQDNNIAIEFLNENGYSETVCFSQLYKRVAVLSDAFRQAGVQPGDRIAAIMPNIPDTIVAMLATSSLGAIWSCCAPDFGYNSLVDRFEQIEPKIVIYCDSYFYKGKKHSVVDKVSLLLDKIQPETVLVVDYPNNKTTTINTEHDMPGIRFLDFLNGCMDTTDIKFEQVPFDHPIYILYSSGTTGVPKCIAHGGGGTLLQHIKELALHVNITREDKLFYYTSTGWMMWNWQLSALALGATITLYDGNPFYPKIDYLLECVVAHNITVFGCSAKYINVLSQEKVKQDSKTSNSSLRTLLSTGSPLLPEAYDYIKNSIKSSIQICSISGGTDIVSCFALGNPLSSVYRGELQGLGLAMAVEVFDKEGTSIEIQKGELVCTAAFPSMPVYFWNDPDNRKYHKAYFEKYYSIWTHGDYAEITQHSTQDGIQQGLIIYGRSDATLNPGGVRIGTAEIYRQVELIDFISDGIVVSQSWNNDQRIILFVQLKNEQQLTESMIVNIKTTIRENASPHHVPEKIIQIHDIPRTYNGKLAELAVCDVIHDRPVKNLSALINPDSLKEYEHMGQLQ